MVHYIDKPALLYATTYVLQLVVIHTSEAEEDALFGNSARVGGLKIRGHSSVYRCHKNFELTNKFCNFHGYQRSGATWIKNPYAGVCSLLAFYI